MSDFITSAPRYRGYRIKVYHGQGKPSTSLPIIWASTIPARWEEIKQDATITQAILFRSGRKYQQWNRESEARIYQN